MANVLTVSLDAMGGDGGPDMVIAGVEEALLRHPEVRFLLYGDQARMAPALDRHPRVRQASQVRHCEVSVGMDDKPSQALRRGRRVSSMWRAIEAVRDGEAAAVVSAGNTGALMAMSKFVLDTIPGISRPAIAAIWPTLRSESIVLDVGATIGADAEQLIDYAIMGEAMARCLFGIERPTVGLLNIGVEEVKGLEQIKEAGRLLRASSLPIEYYGFVEGNDIGNGSVDVVVTEGFNGNIALKTAEGTARQIATYLRQAMERSLITRIGFFLAQSAFRVLKEKMDPRARNGGLFLGLNGIVVKSHGGTDALGFASAVDLAIEMAVSGLIDKIGADLAAKRRLQEIESAADAASAIHD
jgi:glycerol-3-phosphate acyltransferase PlsX